VRRRDLAATAGGIVTSSSNRPYVSRGGEKLAFALDHFAVDCTGRVCADLGSHTGGFVDCLLQRGAARVYSIDTGYGVLAWKLRKDDRVVVMERTNALHATLPEPISLVTIDVGWTRQHLILPAAIGMLGQAGAILSLVKPHYEAPPDRLRDGVLPDDRFDETMQEIMDRLDRAGLRFDAVADCPLRGHGGNRERWGYWRRAR
jgi:23S rRNA (cytidine1920-2'-O)/16S rRNA (cytidine1409-2'-O)-methyltransferase